MPYSQRVVPHQSAFHALAVLIGTSALITPPRGLALLVPHWELYLWAALLLATGITGLVAPILRLPERIALERATLWLQSLTLAWIVISAVYYQGANDLLGLAAYVVWIAANVARGRQIASALTKLRHPPGE